MFCRAQTLSRPFGTGWLPGHRATLSNSNQCQSPKSEVINITKMSNINILCHKCHSSIYLFIFVFLVTIHLNRKRKSTYIGNNRQLYRKKVTNYRKVAFRTISYVFLINLKDKKIQQGHYFSKNMNLNPLSIKYNVFIL